MTSKYHQQAKARKKKRKTTKFPDLNKDGKIYYFNEPITQQRH